MSEPQPISPDQIHPANSGALPEELQQQQNTIHGFVDSRIQADSLEVTQADLEAAKFGLEAGKYEVYVDAERPFGGGFKKFISKDDPAEVLAGLTFAWVGGNVSDPNRSLHNYLLRPNGDIVGRISTENSKGIEYTDIYHPGHSSDPERANTYDRFITTMFKRAEELIAPRDENTPQMAGRELKPLPRKRRLGRLLGRSSLR